MNLTNIKIASINTQRITSKERQSMLLHFCEKEDYDIIGLQELTFPRFLISTGQYVFIQNANNGHGGTGFLIKRDIKHQHPNRSSDGRILSINVGEWKLVNIYAPAGRFHCPERDKFFANELPLHVHPAENVILFGDFNAIIRTEDRQETRLTRVRTNNTLSRMLNDVNLKDCWPLHHPTDPGHTHFYSQGSSRLD